jgi:hypothetical protein
METLHASASANAAVEIIEIITTQVPGYYKCGHCALHFKTRARFRAHEATCLSLKQIRARATFVPNADHAATTSADLFALVQQLAVRLETAEHELDVLKQQQRNQEKRNQEKRNQEKRNQENNQIHRDNLLEWLNGHKILPAFPFTAWLPAIPPITREHLALVFQHGFMDGMCAIIASIVAVATTPLCAYDEASGLLIYETDTEPEPEPDRKPIRWRPMTQSEFERFINRMHKLLMNEFVCWQQEHKERWHDPDFAEQYDANLLKVTGSGKGKSGGCSNRDMLMIRMKPKVYAAIKRSANGPMQ